VVYSSKYEWVRSNEMTLAVTVTVTSFFRV
jgi:hypothetical protein